MLNNGVSFGAVGFTSTMNMAMVRKGEMTTGIDVKTEEGELIGVSKIAATSAIKQTAICRFGYCVPIFFLPPVLTTMQKAYSQRV